MSDDTKPVGMPHRFECNDYCRDASLPGSPLADLEFQSGHGLCWQAKARVTIVTTNIDEDTDGLGTLRLMG